MQLHVNGYLLFKKDESGVSSVAFCRTSFLIDADWPASLQASSLSLPTTVRPTQALGQ